VSGKLYALVALLPGKNYALCRRLGWSQSQSRCFLEEKNIFSVPGFKLLIVQFVACVLSTLSAHNDCVIAVQRLQKLLNSSTHGTQTIVVHVSVAVY
jgi:hypothetical protein